MAEDRSQQQNFYAAPWDADLRIPASELRSLSLQKQQDIIEHWFSEMFDSPVDLMAAENDLAIYPFDGGGKTEAKPAMLNEFNDIAEPAAITAAAAAVVESEGIDIWAPNIKHPDNLYYRRPTSFSVGNTAKKASVPPVDNNKDQSGVYEHPSDGKHPLLSPDRIHDLSHDDQVRLIGTWFFNLFEDPANEMPYDKEDGGYQYIHGGPYDAREQIEAEFIDYVDQAVIDGAVDFVEADGTAYWAPSSNHPARRASEEDRPFLEFEHEFSADEDPTAVNRNKRANLPRYLASDDRSLLAVQHDIEQRLMRGVAPRFGSDREKRLRSEIHHQASALKVLIKTGTPKRGGIGHNQPPEDLKIDDLKVDEETKESLAGALETIERQTRSETPDAREVSEAAGVLRKVVTYLSSKADKTVDAFCNRFGSELGAAAAYGVCAGIAALFVGVLHWLDLVTLPF